MDFTVSVCTSPSFSLKKAAYLNIFKICYVPACTIFFFFWGLQSWLAFSYCPKLHLFWGFPCDTVVKNLPAMQEIQLQSLGQEDPLEKGMAIHSSILAWRISWTEQPGGLQSMGLQSQTRLSNFHFTFLPIHFFSHWAQEQLFCPCFPSKLLGSSVNMKLVIAKGHTETHWHSEK